MKKFLFIVLMFIGIAVIIPACVSQNSARVTEKTDTAYLTFTGNTKGITISVNEGKEFRFNPKIELYEIPPGKVTVKVYRGDTILVDRIIFVDSHSTFEIRVP